MNHIIEKQYPYVMGWRQLLFLISIGAALGVFMTYQALNNSAGLAIGRIIELSPKDATIFLWCLASIMYALILLGLMGIFEKIKGRSRIAITEKGIILPNRPWRKGEAFVPYSSIKELSFRNVNNNKFLNIRTTGLTYVVASVRLPKQQDFDEIIELLAKRTKI